jgi:hypothetical protein
MVEAARKEEKQWWILVVGFFVVVIFYYKRVAYDDFCLLGELVWVVKQEGWLLSYLSLSLSLSLLVYFYFSLSIFSSFFCLKFTHIYKV